MDFFFAASAIKTAAFKPFIQFLDRITNAALRNSGILWASAFAYVFPAITAITKK